jgi:hypothetical protein
VPFYGAFGDAEAARDLPVGVCPRNQFDNFLLAFGKQFRAAGPRDRSRLRQDNHPGVRGLRDQPGEHRQSVPQLRRGEGTQHISACATAQCLGRDARFVGLANEDDPDLIGPQIGVTDRVEQPQAGLQAALCVYHHEFAAMVRQRVGQFRSEAQHATHGQIADRAQHLTQALPAVRIVAHQSDVDGPHGRIFGQPTGTCQPIYVKDVVQIRFWA